MVIKDVFDILSSQKMFYDALDAFNQEVREKENDCKRLHYFELKVIQDLVLEAELFSRWDSVFDEFQKKGIIHRN